MTFSLKSIPSLEIKRLLPLARQYVLTDGGRGRLSTSKQFLRYFKQIFLSNLMMFFKPFCSKTMYTCISSVVFRAKSDNWSISSFTAKSSNVVDFASCPSVAQVITKDTSEPCDFVKVGFFSFCWHYPRLLALAFQQILQYPQQSPS